MNLYWPPAVPYSSPFEEQSCRADSASTQTGHKRKSSNKGDTNVYTGTLSSTQVRLAFLIAVPREDYPVQLALEVFEDDNRPEYETVSYMWGGEDGNSALCRPVFVGPHWDVLLQTQNCHCMLQFVRPWRGIRTLWVDALCINQKDLEERSLQVAKMREIYDRCDRVVVYLGPDMVGERLGFPLYCTLDQALPEDVPVLTSLRELIERPYFGRVWMIQKLVIAERAIIRINNVDIRVDSNIIQRITNQPYPRLDWEKTAAPWLQYLGHKILTSVRSPMYDAFELLTLTSGCDASDMRDRVFAVMPLLRNGRDRDNLSEPDYKVSFQHLMIDFFAYSLMIMRYFRYLDYAGIANEEFEDCHSYRPTWVPDCRSESAWMKVFRAEQSAVTIVSNHLDKTGTQTNGMDVYFDEGSTYSLEYFMGSRLRKAGLQDSLNTATIDRAYRALEVVLTHLFVFEAPPVRIVTEGDIDVYSITPDTYRGSSPLFLITHGHLVIRPWQDHVFLLPTKSNTVMRYYLLRRMNDENGLPTYKLVSATIGITQASDPRLDRLRSETYMTFQWPWLHKTQWDVLFFQTSVATTLRAIGDATVPSTWGGALGFADSIMAMGIGQQWNGVGLANTCRAFLIKGKTMTLLYLAPIRAAYNPPPDDETLLKLVENGPTEEQEYIGVPKWVGGVKIDGSSMRVRIA